MFPRLPGCRDLILVYILKDHLLFNKPFLSKPELGMYVPKAVANPPAPQPGLPLHYSRVEVGSRGHPELLRAPLLRKACSLSLAPLGDWA